MRKVKLFFLLTALLAIAQGMWAGTQNFNSFSQGNNTQSPVTVNCVAVYSSKAYLKNNKNITITVSSGYEIKSMDFNCSAENRQTITISSGQMPDSQPTYGSYVNSINSTSFTMSTTGEYLISSMEVNYAPINYTISYTLNGGSISGSYPTSYNIETNTFTLKNPTRSGYTFTGWTGSNGSTKQTSVSIAKGSTGNKSYTANWQAITYTVSYNANGGTGAPAGQTKTHGTNLTLRDKGSLSRTGYTTDGWATSTGGNKAYNFGGTYSNNAAITLYAHWNANTYKVKFNGNGSNGGSMSDQNFTYGTAQNLTANGFSKTGYTFAGWATSSTGAKVYNNQQSVNNLTSTNGGTFNLYALWSVVNYTISYTLNGGTATNPTNYNITTNTFTLNNPTRDGYTFTGWTGSNGSTPQTSVSIEKGSTGNKNYTANWICQAAVDVMNLINAIGTPITLDSKDAIDAARTAYNALTDAQKTEVTNYATLTAAEAAYNTLVTDHAAADAVIAQINAIGSPITATSQTAIEDARNAYNALTDTQKGYVTNYSELTDAEAALAVVNLINAIGSPITAASQTAIDAARNAYDALSNDQKALVGNLSALTDAEAALVVVNQIAAIGEVTLSSGSTIADVRTAYNALTGDQQALVGNYSTLTDAEDAYASLNVDITAKADPVNDGVYYSTFYDGSRQLQLPANVEAYTATVSGDKMLLKKVAVPGDILPAATAVVLRASQANFTLTPSAASSVSVENNALRGTDVNMEVPSDHCYVLSGADGFVGFYPLSAPYTLSAHKAFIDLDNLPGGAKNAPRRLRFVLSEEQTATGIEDVQGDNVQSTKVLENGVLYIIKNGVRYNAQGQIVK